RRAKVVQVAQAVPQFLAGFPPRPCFDQLFQLGLVLAARRRSQKTGILREIVPSHQMRELRPDLITDVGYPKREETIRHWNRLVADIDAGEIFVHRADHETEHRLLHRHHDLLPLSGPLAGVERCENAYAHAYTRSLVADAQSLLARGSAVPPLRVGPSGHAVVGLGCVAIVRIGP